MPRGYENCVKKGGRVRRISGPSKPHGLKSGEYVNFCYIKGKSYRGYVKTKKHNNPKKKSSYMGG